MQKPFKTIEHTADIGLEASGANPSEAFSNIGLGMFHIMTDIEKIDSKKCLEVNVSAEDIESLAVEWLNELLFLFQTKSFLFRDFNIKSIDNNSVKAICCGEKYDEQKHPAKVEIKAVTYFGLSVKKNKNVKIRVTFDI